MSLIWTGTDKSALREKMQINPGEQLVTVPLRLLYDPEGTFMQLRAFAAAVELQKRSGGFTPEQVADLCCQWELHFAKPGDPQ